MNFQYSWQALTLFRAGWTAFKVALPSHTPSLKLLDLSSILKALGIEYLLRVDEPRDCGFRDSQVSSEQGG